MKFNSLIRLFILLVFLLFFGNCATTLTNFHPADTLKKNQVQISYGAGLNFPASTLGEALSTILDLNDKIREGEEITEEEQKKLLKCGLAIAINPPTGSNEFQFRYGFGGKFELGVKWAISALITDLRYQFMDTDGEGPSGWNGSIGFGIGYTFFEGVLFDILEYLNIDDFYRVDLRIPLLFGKTFGGERRIFHLWMGPMFMASWYKVDEILGTEVTKDKPLVGKTSGWWYYLNNQIGGAVGYKYVWLSFELNIAYLWASTTILGEEVDLSGVIVFPILGIIARFP